MMGSAAPPPPAPKSKSGAAGSPAPQPTYAAPSELLLDTKELKKTDGDDPMVVEFVDKLLMHAIKSKVSDIHIEPFEKFTNSLPPKTGFFRW